MRFSEYTIFFTVLTCVISLFSASDSHAESKNRMVKLIHIETGKTISEFAINECENNAFALEYVHSVDLTPVIEIYRLNEVGDIIVNEINYKSFGAGMQATKPATGYFAQDSDWIILRDINRVVERYILRVGNIANQRIRCAKRTINLLDYVGQGERILITAK